jgi:hypothetical protein
VTSGASVLETLEPLQVRLGFGGWGLGAGGGWRVDGRGGERCGEVWRVAR